MATVLTLNKGAGVTMWRVFVATVLGTWSSAHAIAFAVSVVWIGGREASL
jgi:hypothetical protein